jgi:succinate dehydrogenase hydrophobic anchor subunit
MYSNLKLDIVYTIMFVGPMHMLKTKKIIRFLWGVENGVCGNNVWQIFNILALVLISPHFL